MLRNSLLVLVVLAGCRQKDSSGDSTPAVVDVNQTPIANAGTDQTVPGDGVVTLSGAGSSDPDGDALTYLWAFDHVPAGSAVTSRANPFSTNHATDPMTTFTPDVLGTYVISLTVRDPAGATSAADYVVINAGEPDSIPVAHAGADQSVGTGSSVTLDGSGSFDPGGRALSYSWSVVQKPDGSSVSGVSDPTVASPSFTADKKGVYVASLTVNNGLATSAADTVTVTATAADNAPVANAGADQAAEDCTTVSLDCSNSDDPDDDALSYYWDVQLKPSNSNVSRSTFSNSTGATTTFYPDQAGTYVLSCAVYDGSNWSTPDTMTVAASERTFNTAPAVNAGADQTVAAGSAICEQSGYVYNCDECADQTVTIGSDAVINDPDGDPYTVQWEVIEGDDITLSNAATLVTTITMTDLEPEEPGACNETEARLRLTVTDCTGAAVTDVVSVVASCCGIEDTSSSR